MKGIRWKSGVMTATYQFAGNAGVTKKLNKPHATLCHFSSSKATPDFSKVNFRHYMKH